MRSFSKIDIAGVKLYFFKVLSFQFRLEREIDYKSSPTSKIRLYKLCVLFDVFFLKPFFNTLIPDQFNPELLPHPEAYESKTASFRVV